MAKEVLSWRLDAPRSLRPPDSHLRSPYVVELALEFDDGQLLAPQFEDLVWTPATFAAKCALLGALLTEMSGEHEPDLWAASALRTANE